MLFFKLRSLRPSSLRRLQPSLLASLLPLASVAVTPGLMHAQTVASNPAVLVSRLAPVDPLSSPVSEPVTSSSLPDAPGYAASAESASSSLEPSASLLPATAPGAGYAFAGRQVTPNANGRYDKTVLPGHAAARLSVHDKVFLGVKENLSPISLAGWVISAGYEQATDGSPNYGQTAKGFAQRLGASAARSSSENVFGDSILASVLHEDPRYYKLGSSHNFFTRLFYAGTRPIIGKTDGGKTTINFSDLGGDLAGAALTPAYYPPLNRSFDEVLKTFGGSVGGDALGFVVSEFLADTLHGLHLTTRKE